jgi:7-carboxy-7-deazaguanine synthase
MPDPTQPTPEASVRGGDESPSLPITCRISEIFLSIQGEGPSAGVPAHFIRLQGCDVGCHWCDSRYTWAAAGGSEIPLDELWARAAALGHAPMLVLTGGEPLEHPGVEALIGGALERWARVEVETSGVLPPPCSEAGLHWNVSPKLPSATPRASDTWAHVERWIEEPRAVFKIVVGDDPDLEDALQRIETHRLPRERVMLMPEGLTDARVRAGALRLAEICRREGLRLSPRLHIWMWGAKRGV